MDEDQARAALRDFHRLRRRMLWSTRHGWFQLVATTFLTVRRFFGFVLEVARDVRAAGPLVRERHGVPVRRQLLDVLGMFLKRGHGPQEYYEARLFLPERRGAAEFQVRVFHNVDIFGGFHGWTERPFDKLEFERRASDAGLPTIPTLATCPPGGPPSVRLPDSPLWDGDLFTKRSTGGRGKSQRRWRRVPGGGWTDGGETVGSREQLLAHLCRIPRGGRRRRRRGTVEIVQPCMENHDAIRDVTRSGLSTVRICTAQRSGGRSPEVVFVAMKLVVGDQVVDNLAAGPNLVTGVDLATGRLGPAFRLGPGHLLEPVAAHPDSGRPVEGLELPFWEEAVELCRRGQAVFPETPSLGWDVALTPDGPVLVEANIMWGPADLTGWPIGLTPYPRWTVEWIEEALSRS